MERKKRTKKEYREMLNCEHPFNPNDVGKGKNGRYKPSRRPYGDYLYAADREMFDTGYEEWLLTL